MSTDFEKYVDRAEKPLRTIHFWRARLWCGLVHGHRVTEYRPWNDTLACRCGTYGMPRMERERNRVGF